jgi:5'(3')-deoxyribonucleotidase
MRLGLDVDGVLRGWDAGLRQCWEDVTGEWVPPEQVRHWDLRRTFQHPAIDPYDLAFRSSHVPHIQLQSPLVAGAAEALRQLSAAGVELVLITAQRSQETRHGTARWLVERGLPFDALVFSHAKAGVSADLYVDDGPPYLAQFRAAGVPHLIFDQPYNREEPGERVTGWEAALAAILQRLRG